MTTFYIVRHDPMFVTTLATIKAWSRQEAKEAAAQMFPALYEAGKLSVSEETNESF